MKIFDYEEVKMNWDSFTYPIAVGTPVSIDGGLADNASAHGLIARTVFAKPDADETLKVMTGGIIDMEEIVAGYGQELSSAAVQALCGIHFYKDGVCIPSGGSGGGGVTPEIMAQIENAQWKTESSEQLFSETVTTTKEVELAPYARGILVNTEYINADTLTVTFNGTEYTLTGTYNADEIINFYGAPYDVDTDSHDFSVYPFTVISSDNGDGTAENLIATETPGTYTVSASVDTVTTTDTFKQAVNDIAGWKTETSEQLFSETVTTVAGENGNEGVLTYSTLIDSDFITMTFNGVEYACPKQSVGPYANYYGAPFDPSTGPDFSEIPFMIASFDDQLGTINTIYTQTPGEHTVVASADTTVCLDSFKEGVHKNVLIEVETEDEADIVILIPKDSASTTVQRNCLKFNPANAPTEYTMGWSTDQLIILYRDASNGFSNARYEYSRDGLTILGYNYYGTADNDLTTCLRMVGNGMLETVSTYYDIKYLSFGLTNHNLSDEGSGGGGGGQN